MSDKSDRSPMRRAVGIALAFAACLCLSESRAMAAPRYVWTNAPSSGAPYTSWSTAATNIRDAVNVAQAGETVWVTNGLYGITNQIVVTNGITVRSVNGKDVTVVTRADANEYRLFLISNATAVVDGFTVSNGYARAPVIINNGHSYGGGILLYDGTVRNCRIVGNTSRADAPGVTLHGYYGYGGGIYMVTGLVENCELIKNVARGSGGSSSGSGGGIQNMDGTIISCVITGNFAYGTGNGQGHGGGVRITGVGRLLNSDIKSNKAQPSANIAPAYGAGVHMSGNGVVSNCVVAQNNIRYWQAYGGGIYMTAGLVTDSLIVSNWSESVNAYSELSIAAGAGVYVAGGTLRNCIISRNRGTHVLTKDRATRGAGVLLAGGRMEHCTVTGNYVESSGRGAGLYMTSGEVWNSVLYHNYDQAITNFTPSHENVYQEGGTFNYSCTTNSTSLSGVSNIFLSPGFADRTADDFHLLPGSPCIDSGTNLPTVVTDRDGNTRPMDGDDDAAARYDMGAYEAGIVTGGPFRVNFVVNPEVATGSVDAVFTAYVAGTNRTGLTYVWDFTYDGSPDQAGAGKGVVTNSYAAPGFYTVSLIVSNSGAESATLVRTAAVKVYPSTVYVASAGGHVVPYGTWADAATNVQAAIDVALSGTTVLLSNGAYAVSTPVIVGHGITISSVNGPAVTAIERADGANTRIMLVNHADAIVERITIRNGSWVNSGDAYGGGVRIIDGLVRNCIITNNVAQGQPNQPGRGGGVHMAGGTLRNCLVLDNECRGANQLGHGGGIFMVDGLVESCTVVSNYASRLDVTGASDATRGGGIRKEGGIVTNSIVVDNGIRVVTPTEVQISISGSTDIGFSCSPDLTHDPGGTGNITNSPVFEDVLMDDYRLADGSPGIDAGTNRSWMIGALDLAGTNRIMRAGGVDIGAYETFDPTAGPLTCDFTIPATEGFTNFTAVFTASFIGTDTNIQYYWWSFGDSNVEEGVDKKVVTNIYTSSGFFDVALTVSNSTAETDTELKAGYIYVAPGTIYVSTNGGHLSPFSSWADAATNIQDAADLGRVSGSNSTLILVSNGVYSVTNRIAITEGVTLRSVNGRDLTSVTRAGSSEHRIFLIAHADAVVDGFSITNGYGRADVAGGDSYGGGVRITSGTLRNCRVADNTSRAGAEGESPHGPIGYGGGIYMVAGLVENCLVINNTARGSGGSSTGIGGGIENQNGTIISCVITGNFAYGTGNGQGHGGGVRITGVGRLLNSEIRFNKAQRSANVLQAYGGGVYMSGNGVVSNCVVGENNARYWQSYGGGVYMTAGLVTDSLIVSNWSESAVAYADTAIAAGAGVYLGGGTLRNCVIFKNRCTSILTKDRMTRGAGVLLAGGSMEHCTVSGNYVDASGRGDGLYMTGGEVWNSVLYYNYDESVTNFTLDHENVYQTGGTFNYSCTTNSTTLSGVSNVFADPGFANRAADDFHLLPGSPCIDSGTNMSTIVTDFDGNARPTDGDDDAAARYDMGAYEAGIMTGGPFRVNFVVNPEVATGSVDVVFTAYVAGTNLTGLTYVWDFTNDGTPDESGAGKGVVTNNYGSPGFYTVSLIVSNSGAESATLVKIAVVRVYAPIVYVAPGGGHVAPYGTWADAATNVQAAIDVALSGTTVLVSNGVYVVETAVIVRRGITVSSVNGPAVTAIDRADGANTRIMLVTHADAIVEGLTIQNGSWVNSGDAYGGGVRITDGLVRNCIITNNLAQGQPNQPGRGGGVHISGGTLRNCLVLDNESRAANQLGYGGGIFMAGGQVENCTVVSNYAWRIDATGASDDTRGGGIRKEGGTIFNSIVVNNRIRVVTTNQVQISLSGTEDIRFSCSPDLTHDPEGTGNITNTPIFLDPANRDYHLTDDSAGIDGGTNLSWMTGAFDLGGKARVANDAPDIGAYETYVFPSGTLFLFR